MRTVVRSTLIAGMTGALMVSAAWAGIGISPLPLPTAAPVVSVATGEGTAATALSETATGEPLGTANVAAGEIFVGAAKNSMNPRPEDMQERFPGARWETDPAKCKTVAPEWFQDLPTAAVNALDGIANPGSVWPENPSCIYQGGFSLGPMNPVKSFDQTYGLWVRSVAFSDGSRTLVKTVIDGEGWLWDYKSKCTDCGAKQIAAALAADPELQARGVTAASHILHATHSHASPDFIGGWGFVPNWYMAQITDTIKATAKQAVMTMQRATLEVGEQEARAYNSERRDTYRAAEEGQISWLRAVAVETAPPPATEAPATTDTKGGKKASPSPSPSPTAEPAPKVIATVGTYAAHPTSVGTNGGVAHPDWPGLFETRVEDRFGGVGLHFMSGLGNLSNSGGVTIGTKLADLLPGVGAGRPVDDTTLTVRTATVTSALTNVPLTTLGTPGLFDRKFDTMPAAVSVEEGDSNTLDNSVDERIKNDDGDYEPQSTAPCVSSSPQSVELPVSTATIGNDIVITAAPGEVFANYTNTIKEKSVGKIAFPLAQANDALGYMPQSFEINPVGQQGLGFAAGGWFFVNYEDSYAIDRCTGDLVLEKTMELLSGR